MIEKFQQNIQEYCLLDSNKSVLLAVSGGVDSVVLLDLMSKIPHAQRPQLTIAHLNHQLRAQSNDEEQFVKELAKNYRVKFYSEQWPVKMHPPRGIEKAARKVRYHFFKRLMNENKIPYLMTGHHLDDQIETILMRLTRGASLKQLLGIHEKQRMDLDKNEGYLVRPLLDFSKEEIYQYAKKNQLSYVEDESNQSLDYTRNRFRNSIIPLLKEENDRFNKHVEQFRKDLNDLIEITEEPIMKAYEEMVREKEQSFYLNLKRYFDYPEALQKAVLTKVLKKLYRGKSEQYKTNYIDLIQQWILEGEVNTSLDLTGDYLAEKRYEELVFKQKEFESKHSKTQKFEINQLNQWLELSERELIGLFSEDFSVSDTKQVIDELIISEDKLELPLTVRHRKAGDRMTYQGLSGRKKIKDIFIDDKTPSRKREKAWLVEDANQQIIWLISYRKMNLLTESETDKLSYSLKYAKK